MAIKTSKKKSEKKDLIINNIDIRAVNRTNRDIQDWRDAHKSAESVTRPNRTRLYDLYHDIIIDGHVESVLGKRQNAINNIALTFRREDGSEDEQLRDLINTEAGGNFLVDILDSKFWGYTLIEVTGIRWDDMTESWLFDYDLIPRKHVMPEYEVVTRDQQTETFGIKYKEPPYSKYCIWAGTAADLGLLLKICPWVLYKRGNFGDWAQYAEIFGMPFREYIYEQFDDTTRQELEKMAEQYAGAGYAILPKGTETKLHQPSGTSGSNNIYKDLKDACNEEISKAIVSQTMTTEDGSSRSQAEVHERAEDEIKKADKKFILSHLNGKFKAILQAYGFNTKGGHFCFVEAPNLDIQTKKLNIATRVRNIVPVDDDYFYETFNIPRPDNYEQLKKEHREQREKPAKPPQNNYDEGLLNKVKNFFG